MQSFLQSRENLSRLSFLDQEDFWSRLYINLLYICSKNAVKRNNEETKISLVIIEMYSKRIHFCVTCGLFCVSRFYSIYNYIYIQYVAFVFFCRREPRWSFVASRRARGSCTCAWRDIIESNNNTRVCTSERLRLTCRKRRRRRTSESLWAHAREFENATSSIVGERNERIARFFFSHHAEPWLFVHDPIRDSRARALRTMRETRRMPNAFVRSQGSLFSHVRWMEEVVQVLLYTGCNTHTVIG